MNVKITRGQVPALTRKLLSQQNGKCLICGEEVNLGKASSFALDHCHETGLIRGVLHSTCNAAEGKVRHYVGRFGARQEKYELIIPWLKNLISYLERDKTNYIHYTHRSAEEHKMHKSLLARKRRAAAKAKKEMKS